MSDRDLLEAILEKVSKIDNIAQDMTEVKKRLTSIEMTIENELQPNIMSIADRQIDPYYKSELRGVSYNPETAKYEILESKINAIESDVSILKKVVIEHSEKLQKIS